MYASLRVFSNCGELSSCFTILQLFQSVFTVNNICAKSPLMPGSLAATPRFSPGTVVTRKKLQQVTKLTDSELHAET